MDRASAGWLGLYVVGSALLYFFVKAGLAYAQPLEYTVLRFVLSAAVLLALTRSLTLNRYVALLAAASSVVWAWGLMLVLPATSASLSYFMPFVAIIMGFLALGERLDKWGAAGTAIGAVGVSLYAVESIRGRNTALGVGLTLFNTVLWAGYTVLYRKIAKMGKSVDMSSVNLSMFLLGTVMMLPFVALDPSPVRFNLTLIASLAWASTMGGALQFLSWSRLLERMSVSRVTLLSYLVPAAAAGIQAVMGEPPDPLQALGLGIMVLGAYVALR
ncbi:predicted permease [Acidilobus saccharovorans 345-15]|uniref:Predicted permease n=1 Tax=Acidilobus saccharovorans (strain DSM 16705 / JCM 18335 / VKM B-2471 / 345-15) TaxID=666510 RepID=D9Q141_ACIS3|nr:DMT family transporter [Acidilobus saccharovorans]ADL19029.1 predicted permease [Acidilobus saccharovorans 345-15]